MSSIDIKLDSADREEDFEFVAKGSLPCWLS
jgi:hypothetical protein